MAGIDVGAALQRSLGASADSIPEILGAAAAEVGGTDVVLYLVDFGQQTLEPIPDRTTHAEVARAEPVASSMAGRAFTDQTVVTAARADGVRVWIPLIEGSDRTGVVALTLPEADDGLVAVCAVLGCLAGYLIAVHARTTDIYNLYRRRRSMSVAASMQWDILPPLVLLSSAMSVAGLVEPAYDVGGDCFDYSDNGPVFDLAIMDAMGHGLHSSVLAALAMGTYRHGRREARGLASMHDSLHETLVAQYDDASFVSGVLARVDTNSGELTWTNAGHPCPLLIRGGQVVGELQCGSTPPWGLEHAPARVGSAALEPGDAILLYTDGVIEAHAPDGDLFGRDRLVDLAQAHASDLGRPDEIVRRLVRAVGEHQQAELRDDATIVLARWAGPTDRR